jgi:hypothetical protein
MRRRFNYWLSAGYSKAPDGSAVQLMIVERNGVNEQFTFCSLT